MIKDADGFYTVFIYYRGFDPKLDRKIERLSKCWTGAGYNGEWRDHSFEFKRICDAQTFKTRVRKLLGRRVSIETI